MDQSPLVDALTGRPTRAIRRPTGVVSPPAATPVNPFQGAIDQLHQQTAGDNATWTTSDITQAPPTPTDYLAPGTAGKFVADRNWNVSNKQRTALTSFAVAHANRGEEEAAAAGQPLPTQNPTNPAEVYNHPFYGGRSGGFSAGFGPPRPDVVPQPFYNRPTIDPLPPSRKPTTSGIMYKNMIRNMHYNMQGWLGITPQDMQNAIDDNARSMGNLDLYRMGHYDVGSMYPGERSRRAFDEPLPMDRRMPPPATPQTIFPNNNEHGGDQGYYYGGRFYRWGATIPDDSFTRPGFPPNQVQGNWSAQIPGLPLIPPATQFLDWNGQLRQRPADSDYQLPPNHELGNSWDPPLQPGYVWRRFADGLRSVPWNPPLPMPDRPLPQGWRYDATNKTVITPAGGVMRWPYPNPPGVPRQNPRPPERSMAPAPVSPAQPTMYTLRTNAGGTLNNPTPAQTYNFTQPQLDDWMDQTFGSLSPSQQQPWINQVIQSITPSQGGQAATWHGNPLLVALGQQLAAADVSATPASQQVYQASNPYTQYNPYANFYNTPPPWQSLVTYNPGGGGSGLYGYPVWMYDYIQPDYGYVTPVYSGGGGG